MATPPFTIDANSPTPTDLISAFPGDEQPFRDNVKSWLEWISNPTSGNLKANVIEGSSTRLRATAASGNLHLWFEDQTNLVQGLLFWDRTADAMRLRAYQDDGTTVSTELLLNGDSGTVAIGGAGGATLTVNGVPVDSFPSGTRMLFQQTSAPTGWTKDVSLNNRALRIVSGTVGSGGTVGFSSILGGTARPTTAVAAGGTVAGTVLAINQIPAHQHTFSGTTTANGAHAHTFTATQSGSSGSGWVDMGGPQVSPEAYPTSSVGDHQHSFSGVTGFNTGGASHTHGFTGASHAHAINMDIQYVDVIIAQKS